MNQSVRKSDVEWQVDESAELLRLAVQVGGIGIYVTDLEGRSTRLSPELCSMLGLPPGTEMSYEEAQQLIDERDRETVNATVEAALRSPEKGAWNSVHRVVRSDGAVRWVSQHGRRTYRDTAEGVRAVRSIGTVIDITHLKEAEAALGESERRLRLALDAARMGTFEADITATEAQIDAQEARLLGLPEGTRRISAEELRKRIPLDDLHASDTKQERLTKFHEAYHHEFRLGMPDGSERWLSAYADVRANRIFGVNFDITPRKIAEACLRESEARLRVATSGAALGVFEWDGERDHAVWANERIYEIFGLRLGDRPVSKREFIDKYLHPGDVPAFEMAITKAMRSAGTVHIICRIKRKGALRWLQMDGKFEATATGEPNRLIGVVADITHRRRLEARAAKLSERLMTIQEEERRNIAQELHDSTVQHLVAIGLTLMKLRPSDGAKEEDQEYWRDVDASLTQAIKELRTFTYLLVPPTLPLRGLHHCLQEYIDGFAARSGLAVKFKSNGSADNLSLPSQRAIFRIVQEALANVYRHASASEAVVEMRQMASKLHVVITDNGRGIHGKAEDREHRRFHAGVGIRGMRMRLDQLGGRLRISEAVKGGTEVHAVLPICDAAARHGT